MTIQIAVAQYPISYFSSWESWEKHIRNWIEKAIKQDASILVFPEYASMELVSLFSSEIQQNIHVQIAEMQAILPLFKETFQKCAIEFGCTIIAPSFPEKVDENYVNRAYVFGPKGKSGYQDKLFMTRFEDEEWKISAGKQELTVFELDSCRFGIQICFDSEFSFGSHLLAQNGAEIILAPSCTETLKGANRVHIGCRARALEQQVYTCVSQTIGDSSWSPAVDFNTGFGGFYATPDLGFPEDGILSIGNVNQEGWLIQKLDVSLIKKVRNEGAVKNYDKHSSISMLLKEQEFTIKYVDLNSKD